MQRNVKKSEVEELLGCGITDNQFEEALEYAARKQSFIYKRGKNPLVLQHSYLVKLTEEYVSSLAFSKFTMDLCREIRNMEKEHLTHLCKGAPATIHIVSNPAL